MEDKEVTNAPISVRRNNFEIWAEILEACLREGRSQSWLLREMRLKTTAIKESLDFLVKSGLIADSIDSNQIRQYNTTVKGEEALITYYKLITKYFGKKRNTPKSDE